MVTLKNDIYTNLNCFKIQLIIIYTVLKYSLFSINIIIFNYIIINILTNIKNINTQFQFYRKLSSF